MLEGIDSGIGIKGGIYTGFPNQVVPKGGY